MTPAKSASGTQNGKKTKSSGARTPLRQGKLVFGASKPGAAAGKAKSPTTKGSIIRDSTDSISISSDSSSEEEGSPVVAVAQRTLRPRREKTKAAGDDIKPDLGVLMKSNKLRNHYGRVRERMGNLPPMKSDLTPPPPSVHSKGQTQVHHILRVFDNSYEYGPCVGVTRLERWERAQAIGLNPPIEVREILLTKQAIEDDVLKHSVFYGDV